MAEAACISHHFPRFARHSADNDWCACAWHVHKVCLRALYVNVQKYKERERDSSHRQRWLESGSCNKQARSNRTYTRHKQSEFLSMWPGKWAQWVSHLVLYVFGTSKCTVYISKCVVKRDLLCIFYTSHSNSPEKWHYLRHRQGWHRLAHTHIRCTWLARSLAMTNEIEIVAWIRCHFKTPHQHGFNQSGKFHIFSRRSNFMFGLLLFSSYLIRAGRVCVWLCLCAWKYTAARLREYTTFLCVFHRFQVS